jgi:hypothetical protein
MDGLYLSTIGKEGKQKNISVSEFNKILNSESGVDLNSIYDNLLSNQGFIQKLSSGKKITEYITEEGDDMTALDAQLLSMNDGQQLGALLSLRDENGNKIATTDVDEAKQKNILHIETGRIIDPSITKDEQKVLKSTMISQLRAMQERKRKEEIYREPSTPGQRVKEDTMRAAYEIALKIGEGGENANRLIDQVVANNDSIENILYNKEKDSWVIEKIDNKGTRSDYAIKVPRNEDGSVDSRNLGVSLMSAISPSYNVEQAELAARDFEKKNPNFSFANKVDEVGRGYIEFPSLDSISFDKNQSIGGLIDSLNDDDVYRAIPQILSKMGIDKGYTIDEIDRPGFAGFFTTAADAVKITIPGFIFEDGNNYVIIEPSVTDKNELKEKIRTIANSIKKSGGLIEGSSSSTSSATGKKQLPGKS